LVIVRWAALPGLNFGNAALIDAQISRDIMLHLASGEAQLDHSDGVIV